MKKNKFLQLCLLGLSLYAFQTIHASNSNAKNGFGASKNELKITGAPWTPWANLSGFYNSKNKTAELKDGKLRVRFYDVKEVPRMSNITYDSPYVKFASNSQSIFYGRKGEGGVF